MVYPARDRPLTSPLLAAASAVAMEAKNATPSLMAPEQHVPLTDASWAAFETTLAINFFIQEYSTVWQFFEVKSKKLLTKN